MHLAFIHKIARFFVYIAAAILLLVLCLYAVLVAINWRDQPPAPEALAFEQFLQQRGNVADADNAYVYLLGMSVPLNEDPVYWGQQRVNWLRQQTGVLSAKGELPGEEFNFDHALADNLETLVDCKHINQECLDQLKLIPPDLSANNPQQMELLSRYRSLIAHTKWFEPLPINIAAPLPSYSLAFKGQVLLFVQAWLFASKADAVAVKEILAADARFWRQTLAASNTLITKMIAIAALQRHFSWGAIILQRLPQDTIAQALPEEWKMALTAEELSLYACWAGEYQFNTELLKTQGVEYLMHEGAAIQPGYFATLLAYLLSPTLKVQDSANQNARYFLETHKKFQVPLSQYPALLKPQITQEQKKTFIWPKRIYNLLGDQLLAKTDMVAFDQYTVRTADLEGFRRLFLLTLELAQKNPAQEDVELLIKQSPLQNPYTDRPFEWDKTTGAVVFTGLEAGARGRFSALLRPELVNK